MEFTRRLFRSRSTNSLSEKHSLSDAHVRASCAVSLSRKSSASGSQSQGLQKSQSVANLSSSSHESNTSTNIRAIQEEEEVARLEVDQSDLVDQPDVISEVQQDDHPETPDIKNYFKKVTNCLIKVTQSLETVEQNSEQAVLDDSVQAEDATVAKKTVSFDDKQPELISLNKTNSGEALQAELCDPQAESQDSEKESKELTIDDEVIPSVKTSVLDITNQYLNVTAFLLDPLVTSEETDSQDEVSRASTVIENKTSSLSKDDAIEPADLGADTVSIIGSTDIPEEESEAVPDIKLEIVRFANNIITITGLMGESN
jgi:hypothetical protein